MAPGCISLLAQHILIIQLFLPHTVECLFLGRLSGWMSSDPTLETSCEAAGGTCTLDIICRLSYGQVLGECGGLYQVCCDKRQGRALGNVMQALTETKQGLWKTAMNPHSCGKPVVSKRRVVGGGAAGFGRFPWMALVRGTHTRCGGALISGNWVVTAGHCVKDHTSVFNGGYRVYLGEYKLYQNVEPLPRQKFAVDEVVIHPKYQFTPQADRYDVALLRLDRPAYLQPHVLPICLPTSTSTEVGQRAWVAGWGATDPESTNRPKILQAVEVAVIDSGDCEAWHKDRGIKITVYKEMVCAGHKEGGRDSCQGDSGGPLMTQDDSGQWRLLGLVSAGYSCAKPGQPGIYHRLAETLPWLKSIVD